MDIDQEESLAVSVTTAVSMERRHNRPLFSPKSKSILRKSTKSLESNRTVSNPPSHLGSPPKVKINSFLDPSFGRNGAFGRFGEPNFETWIPGNGPFFPLLGPLWCQKNESLKCSKIRQTPNGSTDNACCVKHGFSRMCFSLEEKWPRGPFLGFREVEMGPGTL